jgi:hypothetical protein
VKIGHGTFVSRLTPRLVALDSLEELEQQGVVTASEAKKIRGRIEKESS